MIGTGLVLSGGGARGIAHIGVLQGLNEMGIPPGMISGVSSGAIIGALYSAGYAPTEILEIVKAHASSSIAAMILFPGGLFSPSGLRKLLHSSIPHDNFDSLRIPLWVTATDVATGLPISYSSGPLYNILIGSSSIPVLFNPVKIGKHYLVDGGVTDNLPVGCIRSKCVNIIACNVNKISLAKPKKLSRIQLLDRCFHLAISGGVTGSGLQCEVFLEPDTSSYGMFDAAHADQLFEIGYQTVMKSESLFSSCARTAKT